MAASSVVFDAEPLLAYLDDEPGADAVERTIEDVRDGRLSGYVSYVTLSEVTYIAERALQVAVVQEYVDTLLSYGIEPVDVEQVWYPAARVKRNHDCSLGDAFMIATARETDSTALVGADDDFDTFPPDRIERFRDDAA